MNVEKTLNNSFTSIAAYVANLILQFAGRRIFVIFLDIEYLGYQSLFSNVFSLLSVAELGVGGIISFHLYKELVNNNQEEIGKLMFLYKWVYRVIAAVVLVAGLICVPFLRYIVKTQSADWNYIYLIYALQLGSVVFGYFLSYRRTIYIANQREYKCVLIDLGVELAVFIVQTIELIVFGSFILYLSIQLTGKLLSNTIIAAFTDRDYPYLKGKYSLTRSDITKRNMLSDIKNVMAHVISIAVYNGTDNIIISACCGIREVALYGNYFLLKQGVMGVLFYKLLNPVQATIGNIIYSERTKQEQWEQFKVFDVFSFFFACYVGIGFLLFFQPAIQIWMGKEYLLPFSFVVAFSITLYYTAACEMVWKYRSAFGDYAQDRNCMMMSAVLNIAFSLVLVQFFGVTGVQIGTLAAFLPIAYGRIRFVVNGYFGQSAFVFIKKHLLLSVVAAAEGAICWLLTKDLAISVGGIAIRFAVWFIVPLAVNLAIYWRDPYFKGLCGYLKSALSIITTKLKRIKAKGSGA